MSLAAGIRAGRAFVEIGANSAPLEAALQRMRARLASFGAGLAAVGGGLIGASLVGGGAIASVLSKFADAGSAIADAAARTGAAASAMSEYGYAAEMTGASLEDVERAMKQMVRDGKAASDFDAIAASIAAITDPTEQAQAALEHWGKAGIALLPMARQLAELRAEAKRLGITMTDEQAAAADELGDSMDNLSKSIKGSLYSVMAQLAPMITGVTNSLSDAVAGARQWIDANAAMIRPIALAIGLVGALGAGLAVVGGVVYAGSIALGLLSGAVGVVLSPLGILAAGAVAVTTALGGWAGGIEVARSAIEGLFNWAVAEFGDLADTLGATWQGVSQAIAGGDTQAAFGVMTAGLELSWLQMVDKMKGTWGDFKAWFLGGWIDIKTTIAAEMAFVVLKFDEAFVKIKNGLANLFDGLIAEAKNLFYLIEGLAMPSVFGPDTKDAFARMAAQNIAGNVSDFETRQAARRAEMDKAENAFLEFLKTLDQDAKNEKRALQADQTSEAMQAAQQRLSEANQRFSEALDRAAAVEGKAAEQRKATIDAATGKASAFTDSTRRTTQFEANFAGRQIGFRDVQDRIAKATEDSSQTLKSIDTKIDAGVLVG